MTNTTNASSADNATGTTLGSLVGEDAECWAHKHFAHEQPRPVC